MEKYLFLLPSKKIVSLTLSVMMMLNIFSIVLIYNIENIEVSKNYTTDTISKYCNMVVNIPMKITSRFFKSNVSNNIGTLVPIKASESGKKQKKDGFSDLFQYAVVNDSESSTGFVENLYFPALIPFYSTVNNHNYVMDFVMFAILLFIVLFNGTIMLARGDTEDIIKKNIEKKVRLV